MKRLVSILLGTAALALAGPTLAQTIVTTPEGAQMLLSDDLAYKPGELTPEQLASSTRDVFAQDSMNVFRRFPREQTEAMIKFYTGALALRSLSPLQLTSTQQMILTGVGSGQIKLSAGQPEGRKYHLAGGVKGGTGIRYLALTYPDKQAVIDRFVAAGFPAPGFAWAGDGPETALVSDPGGFPVQIVIEPGAQDGSNDGVGIGISVTNLEQSRAFYRDFIGLDELAPVEDPLLGITKYPYRHNETTIYLYHAGDNLPRDDGSAGIQYLVSDAPMVDARARQRAIGVQTPLNKMAGFDLVTVWLSDPDGVTNYFAQVGPNSRTAQQASAGN